MNREPLDTRVTNGRFVGPDAPANSTLTIHNSVIVDEPDHDVWRTVNASGHLVFPGLIQPSGVGLESALEAVRGGVTTATSHDSPSNGAFVDAIAIGDPGIPVVEPDEAGRLSDDQWARLASDEAIHFQARSGSGFPVLHYLYHEGHLRRGLSLERIAAVTSGNIARQTGLYPRKGSFTAGSDGDLFVFDPEGDDPYSDLPWPGRVIFSLLRGKILLYNGQIHTSAGDGVYLG